MNFNHISSFQRHVIATQQDFCANGNPFPPTYHYNLPRVALIVAPGGDDGLGQRQSLGSGYIRISHVADDADVRALSVAHLGQGLLLSRGECDLGLRFGFRARRAAGKREQEKQPAAQKFVHGFERWMRRFVCGDGGKPAASR